MTLRTRLLATALAVTLAAGTTSSTGLAQAQGGQPRGTQVGITVHGHWAIDVRNKDGSLASHTEFENALDPNNGPSLLAGLFNGDFVPVYWWVNLIGTPALCAGPSYNTNCSAGEPTVPVASLEAGRLNTTHFLNLVRTVPRDVFGRPTGTMTLSGFIRVTNPQAGLAVRQVFTAVSTCAGDTGPRTCTAPTQSQGLTLHTLDTPIPVVTDQIVQVQVTLSFS